MSEQAWPLSERLSVLDRPRSSSDDLPEHWIDPNGGVAGTVDVATVRLALDDGVRRVWVGVPSDHHDQLWVAMRRTPGGGGSSVHARSVLSERSATVCVSKSSEDPASVVFGVVADDVEAVWLGDEELPVANNVYLAATTATTATLHIVTPTHVAEYPLGLNR